MCFKNENTEIEIIVTGYTKLPEKYDEKIGKNALSCIIPYSLNRDWNSLGTGHFLCKLVIKEDTCRSH